MIDLLPSCERKNSAKASASFDLAKQNTTESLSSRRREYVSGRHEQGVRKAAEHFALSCSSSERLTPPLDGRTICADRLGDRPYKMPAWRAVGFMSYRTIRRIHRRRDDMHFFSKVVSTGFALSIIVLSACALAWAGVKEEVEAASSAWGKALGEDDPDKVLPFYADDAVLWGTLSPTVRADRAALRDYFATAFKVLPALKVSFGEQLIRVYGNAAVNTGYYTFSYVQNGDTKTLPARYSFTYVKSGDRWLIVDHHSSAMPSTPR
jgi:uncharacterized protein (TIGR02246 family)